MIEPAFRDNGVVVKQDKELAACTADGFLAGGFDVQIGSGAHNLNANLAAVLTLQVFGGAVQRADVEKDELVSTPA